MPSAAFKDLWATVGQGKPLVGLVKNKTRHCDFYWVEARVIPVWSDGRIVVYMSVRKNHRVNKFQLQNLCTHTTSDISTAAAEQTDGIEQINKAVGQMDEMTQQNAALVEQASAASENMAEQARKMKELMSFFTMMGGADSYSEVSTNKSSHQQVLHSNLASGHGDEWQEF